MMRKNSVKEEAAEMTAGEWEDQKLVGAELRRLREALGLSRTDLAVRMGPEYTGELVSRYEEGSVPMDIGPFFAMLRVLKPDLATFTPRHMAARQISDSYLRLDEENRQRLKQIAGQLLSAQGGNE